MREKKCVCIQLLIESQILWGPEHFLLFLIAEYFPDVNPKWREMKRDRCTFLLPLLAVLNIGEE